MRTSLHVPPIKDSLLSGKNAGNLPFSAAIRNRERREAIDAQGFLTRFPAQENRESRWAEQGKKFADTEKPSCSIAYAGIDQKAEPVFDTAAELSASEGAQHYFLGTDAATPPMIDGLPAALSANKRSMASLYGRMCGSSLGFAAD